MYSVDYYQYANGFLGNAGGWCHRLREVQYQIDSVKKMYVVEKVKSMKQWSADVVGIAILASNSHDNQRGGPHVLRSVRVVLLARTLHPRVRSPPTAPRRSMLGPPRTKLLRPAIFIYVKIILLVP